MVVALMFHDITRDSIHTHITATDMHIDLEIVCDARLESTLQRC
jgi:hypothetical protein